MDGVSDCARRVGRRGACAIRCPANELHRRRLGENYNVEVALDFWTPDRDIQVSSQSLGIIGTTIDAVTDLGFQSETFRDWNIVLRPSKKFKFRFGYTPIDYEAESVLTRDIVFNGQKYTLGLPITSDLDWKVWKIGLEYDFVYGEHGFFGFITDVKYTHAQVYIASPLTAEFTKVNAPIPTIGAIARVYPAKGLALTGEITGMKIATATTMGRISTSTSTPRTTSRTILAPSSVTGN